MYVSVDVEVDPSHILAALSDDELRDHGLQRYDGLRDHGQQREDAPEELFNALHQQAHLDQSLDFRLCLREPCIRHPCSHRGHG
jgi:hypothetical protein